MEYPNINIYIYIYIYVLALEVRAVDPRLGALAKLGIVLPLAIVGGAVGVQERPVPVSLPKKGPYIIYRDPI